MTTGFRVLQLAEIRKNSVSEDELKEILGQVANACTGAHAMEHLHSHAPAHAHHTDTHMHTHTYTHTHANGQVAHIENLVLKTKATQAAPAANGKQTMAERALQE